MNTIDIKSLDQKELKPGFKARFIHSENMTISYWEVTKGANLPEHRHFHEQISQVTEGTFQLNIDDKKYILEPGKAIIIPSNALHSGIAITDCKIMDIFSPVRKDYMV